SWTGTSTAGAPVSGAVESELTFNAAGLVPAVSKISFVTGTTALLANQPVDGNYAAGSCNLVPLGHIGPSGSPLGTLTNMVISTTGDEMSGNWASGNPVAFSGTFAAGKVDQVS